MKKKTYQSKVLAIAGIVSVGVILAFVGVSSSLTGQVSPPGKDPGGSGSSKQKPDLTISATAIDSPEWPNKYEVTYTIKNNGGKSGASFFAQPMPQPFDKEVIVNGEIKKITVRSPLLYVGMRTTPEQKKRMYCSGWMFGSVGCVLSYGLSAGETVEFTLIFSMESPGIQCDRTFTLSPATIVPNWSDESRLAGRWMLDFLNMRTMRFYQIGSDANKNDNMSAKREVHIGCSTITTDLSVQLSGPATVAHGGTAEYIATITNNGANPAFRANPIFTLDPKDAFRVVSVTGLPDAKTRSPLAPGASAAMFKLTVRAGDGGNCRDAIVTTDFGFLRTAYTYVGIPSRDEPNTITPTYDKNDENNRASIGVICDPNTDPAPPPAPPVWGKE